MSINGVDSDIDEAKRLCTIRYNTSMLVVKAMSQKGTGVEEVNNSKRYHTGHNVSVRDKGQEKTPVYFVCPLCEPEDPEERYHANNERAVRWHITNADDAHHKNRNGFLDQVVVQTFDSAWERVDEIGSPGSVSYEGEISTEFLPSDVREGTKKAEILLEILRSPNASAMDIAESVYGDRSKNGYVYSLMKEYGQQWENDSAPVKSNKSFKDLNENQKQVLTLRAKHPDWPMERIGDEVGVTQSTVSHTLKKYQDILDHVKARIEARSELHGPGGSRSRSKEKPREHDEGSTETTNGDEIDLSMYFDIEEDPVSSFGEYIEDRRETIERIRRSSIPGTEVKVYADTMERVLDDLDVFHEALTEEN